MNWVISTGCFPLGSYEFLLSVWQEYCVWCPDALFQGGHILNLEWKGSVRMWFPLTCVEHQVLGLCKLRRWYFTKDKKVTVCRDFFSLCAASVIGRSLTVITSFYFRLIWLWTVRKVCSACCALWARGGFCPKRIRSLYQVSWSCYWHSQLNARSGSGSAQAKWSSWLCLDSIWSLIIFD